MDGYKATQTIRQLSNKDKATIPIIALTANAFEEDRKKAVAQGMNGHISKPIDVNKIEKVLLSILKYHNIKEVYIRYIFLFLLTINIKYPIVDVSTIGGNMNLSRLISIIHNQKNSYMNVQLKEFGLSHGQAITLKIIYEENNIKQEYLNKRLQIDKSAVTRILKTLEDKGFIIKKTSKEDKRNHVLSLTSKGKELYPKIKDVIKETTEMMIKDIDQNELILLEELLLKMKMNLEDTYEK